MSKHVTSGLAAVILTLTLSALAFAQTTTTTTQKTVVQNPDGTYTVIEYPVKKEITLNLTPVAIQGAKGVATILRDDDGTRIKLNLTNVPADVTAMTLYAVDDTGAITPLGPIAITNGVGELATTTPLSKFMLIASPETTLAAYDPNTKIFFRSAVPQGMAVIPIHSNPSGEKVAATTAPAGSEVAVTTPAGTQVAAGATYTAPLLGIPTFKKGDDTKIKVDFTGPLTGARANVFVTPHKGGATEVRMRFHDLKEAPAGQSFIVWAVGADGSYQKLGQIVNTGNRNEVEFKSETALPDFGLVITQEGTVGVSPVGPAVATITITPVP
jgi:hypothetical protein